ncbi:hypothetical protein [Segniliparus rugosus]|uniref:Uncharacterized protein n=1 Tax=Segniliparus rugosus (strain ATCC BAA-974 / DSM 45345 / CCUG 50838 / CIP 108380 / JCM 13579 / CDC 945) TaxID=679197 RepID=E5XLP1_SEGRC|nr:hypothetical protein [Segniliparus rugosus]EFV14719.1 hypothetical protein HMPREF9336_00410 [Segniliparus rugosus ATCC BAA-974]
MKTIGISALVLFALVFLGGGHEIIAALLILGAAAWGISGLLSRLGGSGHDAYISPLREAQREAQSLLARAEADGEAMFTKAQVRAAQAVQRARDFADAEARNGGWV